MDEKVLSDFTTAVHVAILFGQDAALAAQATLQEVEAREEEPDFVFIHPTASDVVKITLDTCKILAITLEQINDARVHNGMMPQLIKRHAYNVKIVTVDDDKDEPAEIDMSEVTPGNTEKVYTDQPIPEREK